MELALLSNINSGRNRSGIDAIEARFAKAGARLHRFDGGRPLNELRDQILCGRPGLVVLSSGDGMVQGFWSSLLEVEPAEWPIMALLPRGTTNMTHADIGLGSAKPGDVERLIALHQTDGLAPYLIKRAAVRVDQLKQGPQCGAFFGAAGIVEAIRICKRQFHSHGLHGDLAHSLTMLGMLINLARGRGEISARKGIAASIKIDGEPHSTTRMLLFLATTLDKLLLNSRPYWGDGNGPLRTSWVDYPPTRLWQAFAKVIMGSDLSKLPAGRYHSAQCNRIELGIDETVVLDGEFFDPVPGKPLVLSTSAEASFVRF